MSSTSPTVAAVISNVSPRMETRESWAVAPGGEGLMEITSNRVCDRAGAAIPASSTIAQSFDGVTRIEMYDVHVPQSCSGELAPIREAGSRERLDLKRIPSTRLCPRIRSNCPVRLERRQADADVWGFQTDPLPA